MSPLSFKIFTMIKIRKIKESDKKIITEISSQIWDGEDYIPAVFNKWIKDKNRDFICLSEGGTIHGFASMRIMPDGTVWFEGLRVAQNARGKGYGEKMTEHLIEEASKEKRTIRLSTYFKNYESLHIVKKHGFKKIRGYCLVEKEVQPVKARRKSIPLDLEGVDYLPIDWVFYENNQANLNEIRDKLFGLGDNNGGLYVSVSEKTGRDTTMNIFKIDNSDGNVEEYFKMAESFAYEKKQHYLCTMLPYDRNMLQAALKYGFILWEEAKENVVLLEKRF